MLKQLLADHWPTTPWRDGQYQIFDDLGETEKSLSYELVQVSRETYLAMYHTLSAAGFTSGVDYIIRHVEADSYELVGLQSALRLFVGHLSKR